mgnify:CR=1 FL=1
MLSRAPVVGASASTRNRQPGSVVPSERAPLPLAAAAGEFVCVSTGAGTGCGGTGSRMTIESALLEVARAQRGMFVTRTARALGYDKDALGALVRSGALLHPGRGLYAVAGLVDASRPKWHLHLAYGATLLYDDVAMTSATALQAHDIAIWNAAPAKPLLVRPVDRSASMSAFTVRPRPAGATVETCWGPTVPLPVALLQHCVDFGVAQGLVSTDDALHRRLVTRDELEAAVPDMSRWPKSSRIAAMLSFADEEHESPGESLTYLLSAAQGIELVPQVTITDEGGSFVARVDFVVKGTRVIVEFDGRVKYGDAEALWREKRREDRLRSLGYVVVRLVWEDLLRPGVLLSKIRAGLRVAAAA